MPAQANAGDTITVQVRDFGLINAGSTGYVQIFLNGTEVSSIAVENNTTGAAVLAGSADPISSLILLRVQSKSGRSGIPIQR